MLRLVRLGARAWFPSTGCRVRPVTGAGSEDKGGRVQESSLTLAHRLQGLNAVAEEAVQSKEKPEPVASTGEVDPVTPVGVAGALTFVPDS